MTHEEVGQRFHAQLHAQMPDAPQHPDDPAHDAAVGAALIRGVLQGEVDEAITEYNTWALMHNYTPVVYVGPGTHGHVLDITTAIVHLDAEANVTLVVPYGV